VIENWDDLKSCCSCSAPATTSGRLVWCRIRSLVRTLQADASSSARRRTATARLRVTLRRALQSF